MFHLGVVEVSSGKGFTGESAVEICVVSLLPMYLAGCRSVSRPRWAVGVRMRLGVGERRKGGRAKRVKSRFPHENRAKSRSGR